MSEYNYEEFNLNSTNNIHTLEDTLNYNARHGYEYVGYVPMETGSSGKLYTLGLIFRKE